MSKNGLEKHWSRPANLEPRIWLKEGGIVIRDVTPDMDKYVLEHMVEHFLRDEPLSKSTGLLDDLESLKEFEGLWRDILLPQRVSLVALREGTPGAALEKVGIENPPTVLGANILCVSSKKDAKPNPDRMKGKAIQNYMALCFDISDLVDVYEKYGVDHFLTAAGLSVAPIARGRGLGLLLLKGRIEMCQSMGIPLTKTIFTAIQSQKVAAKAGFQVLAEKEYVMIKDESGNERYPNMAPTKTIQLCARTIP